MHGWTWIILGLGLFLLEILTPGGFYMVFFAAGAVAAGLVSLLAPAMPPWVQILTFVAVSLVSLLLFRKKLVERFQVPAGKSAGSDGLAGESAQPVGDIGPGAVGRAELRGTTWNAKNGTDEKIKKGQRCRVEKVEGLTVWLRPE